MLQSLLMLIVKNEENDILEWICHHSLIGFEKIVIYDNESTDRTAEIIQEASQHFPVEYMLWKDDMAPILGLTKQGAAYSHAIEKYRNSTKWMCFLDGDEFLIPPKNETLNDLLNRMSSHRSFGLNWIIYGSSHLETSQNRLVLEAFVLRSDYSFGPNSHVKMFFQPTFAQRVVNPHFVDVGEPAVNLDEKEIQWSQEGVVKSDTIYQGNWRLHHYIIRSKEHWERRVKRKQPGGSVREWETFKAHDRNDIIDYAAYTSACSVWEQLSKLGKKYKEVPKVPEKYKDPVLYSNSIRCFVDTITLKKISGWAHNELLNDPISLSFYINDTFIISLQCNLSRPDVKHSLTNKEHVGFSYDLQFEYLDEIEYYLTIRDQNNHIVNFYINGQSFDKHLLINTEMSNIIEQLNSIKKNN